MENCNETITPGRTATTPQAVSEWRQIMLSRFIPTCCRLPQFHPASRSVSCISQGLAKRKKGRKSSECHTNSDADISKSFLVKSQAFLMTQYHHFQSCGRWERGGGAVFKMKIKTLGNLGKTWMNSEINTWQNIFTVAMCLWSSQPPGGNLSETLHQIKNSFNETSFNSHDRWVNPSF